MASGLLGLVPIQIWIVYASKVLYILPDNSSNISCSFQPCATLNQYSLDNDGTLPVVSNVEYHFLPGEHHVPENMRLDGLYNLTLMGIADNYSPPVVILSCLQMFIHIVNSKYVVVRNMIFQQCDRVRNNQYYHHETNLMLTECLSCEVRNITFMQYGLVANNLLGNSTLCCIIVNLTTARLNTYLHYHGLLLITKNTKLFNNCSHHFVALDNVSIYSKGNNLLPGATAYYQSVLECVTIWLLQTTYAVTISVNNSHFHSIKQRLFKIMSVSPASYIMIVIHNCLFENIAQLRFMITIVFKGLNKFLTISSCTFRNNAKFTHLIGIEIFDGYNSVNNVSQMNPNIINVKACEAINNTCGFIAIKNTEEFSEYRNTPKVFISGPINITGIFNNEVIVFHFSGITVQIIGPLNISKNHISVIMWFITTNVTIAGDNFYHSCTCDQVIYLQTDPMYVKIKHNSSVMIYNNSIHNEIIYFENEKYNVPYTYCIFQFIADENSVLLQQTNYKIVLKNNYIDNGNMKNCEISFYHYTSHCQWIEESVFHGYDSTIINELIVQHNDGLTDKHKTICICSNNISNCSLDILGQVYPGQTLQVELCVLCSGKDATLYVETHHRSLPSSSCKIAHQNQLINFLAST